MHALLFKLHTYIHTSLVLAVWPDVLVKISPMNVKILPKIAPYVENKIPLTKKLFFNVIILSKKCQNLGLVFYTQGKFWTIVNTQKMFPTL
jgi:hypothetical protein